MGEFVIRDCALLIRMSGLPAAVNLRELRERLAVASPAVLYHHFCETPLVPSFDNPDYRNDFAVWAKFHLGDRVLAERLGTIDPYAYPDLEALREQVVELLDQRLSEVFVVPQAPVGSELFFMEATTVVFDTGRRVARPEELCRAVERMTTSSVYYHFLEARRRTRAGSDDFSAWLTDAGPAYQPAVEALHGIDITFFTLAELRAEVVRRLREHGGQPC
ncbi:MAG: DUF5752 family protein [Thermodesulfobacteriota bacterium]